MVEQVVVSPPMRRGFSVMRTMGWVYVALIGLCVIGAGVDAARGDLSRMSAWWVLGASSVVTARTFFRWSGRVKVWLRLSIIVKLGLALRYLFFYMLVVFGPPMALMAIVQ